MLKQADRILRQVVGMPDYDRYLAHQQTCHPGGVPLTRKEFFAQHIERRYGGKNSTRCC